MKVYGLWGRPSRSRAVQQQQQQTIQQGKRTDPSPLKQRRKRRLPSSAPSPLPLKQARTQRQQRRQQPELTQPRRSRRQQQQQQYEVGCEPEDHHRQGATTLLSMVRIRNPGDLHCMARAICTGIARDRLSPEGYRRFCADANGVQGRAAVQLMKKAGLRRYLNRMCGLPQLNRMQQYLDDRFRSRYRIVLFDRARRCSQVWQAEHQGIPICLLKDGAHVNFLGKPQQLYRCRDYCVECKSRVKITRRRNRKHFRYTLECSTHQSAGHAVLCATDTIGH
jgi:hypothetical protein